MFGNYLLIAIRNLKKRPLFSAINIVGLAIGISASLVIYLLVAYDLGFERHIKDRNSIYRVVSDLSFPGQLIRNGGVATPTGDAVRNEVTGLDAVAAFHIFSDPKVSFPQRLGDNPPVYKKQSGVILTDGNFFRIFPYQWIAGSLESSFNDPFNIVLTESRAKLYFPGNDILRAMGQTIIYNDSLKLKVTGIVKDLNTKSDFVFSEFVSLLIIRATGLKEDFGVEQWGSVSSSSQLFLKLSKGVGVSQIEKQLTAIRNKYAKDDFMKTVNRLQPLSALHFTNDYDMFTDRQAHKPTLYGLLAVAGFLLLLGCINFINLTTAQAGSRAKEIGVRKTMGSSKLQLLFQFLGETFILTTLATIISILITPLLLKMFADFIPADLSFQIWKEPGVLLFIVLLMLLVSVLSGIYPAWVLTRFKPVTALKNQVSSSSSNSRKAILRKSLTVSQFVVAQFLIIATLLVSRQISFAINKDMGFQKEAILTVNTPWNIENRFTRQVLLDKIKNIPEVELASLSGQTPAATGYNSTTMKFNNGKELSESTIEIKLADSTYFKLYGLKMIMGRSPRNGDTAYSEFLINESFARLMGIKNYQDAIGRIVEAGNQKVEVVGVMKDFNMKSIHHGIVPLAYSNLMPQQTTVHVLLKQGTGKTDQWKTAIAKMENAWKQVYPEHDFNYEFYDQKIAGFYKSEQDIARLMKWATGLAILISCLGMLGLVIYTTNQRIKEIGVRKVLGASVLQIIGLLTKEFIFLVIVAFLIAVPIAWWAFSNWLSNFAFKASLNWWIFFGAGILMMAGALFTLSFQTIKAALANPVKALRSE